VIKFLELTPICRMSSVGLLFVVNLAVAENHHLTAVSLSRDSFLHNEDDRLENLSPELAAKKQNEKGVDLVLKSMPEEGIEAFKKGIELDPQNSTLRYNLAGVYLSRGELEGALFESNKSVELKPDDLSFLHRLGEIHFAAKNFSEAAKLFERIASLNPEFNEVVFHLGTVYAMQQRWPEAENTLRRAREIYPSHSSIDTNLANVLIMTHKFSEAAKILEKVNKQEPSAEVNLALGIADEAAGKYEGALKAYEAAKSLGSKDDQIDARVKAIEKKISDNVQNNADAEK